jgi:hypothetical protein
LKQFFDLPLLGEHTIDHSEDIDAVYRDLPVRWFVSEKRTLMGTGRSAGRPVDCGLRRSRRTGWQIGRIERPVVGSFIERSNCMRWIHLVPFSRTPHQLGGTGDAFAKEVVSSREVTNAIPKTNAETKFGTHPPTIRSKLYMNLRKPV